MATRISPFGAFDQTYSVDGVEFDEIEPAWERAAESAQWITRTTRYRDGTPDNTEIVAAPYECVEEAEEYLWVRLPIGLVGIPHRRSLGAANERSETGRVTAVWTRPALDGAGVQCSSVKYVRGSSTYSGVVLSLDQLARRPVSVG